jgi:hypothetical protein
VLDTSTLMINSVNGTYSENFELFFGICFTKQKIHKETKISHLNESWKRKAASKDESKLRKSGKVN